MNNPFKSLVWRLFFCMWLCGVVIGVVAASAPLAIAVSPPIVAVSSPIVAAAAQQGALSDERHCSGEGALSLSFIGDIMAHRPNFAMKDYDRVYAGVRSYLQSDDLTFANLEAPVDDRMEYRTYPRFNVQSPYVEAAIRGGVEVFSLANNHINDWGVASLEGTARAFRELAREGGRAVYTNGIRHDDRRFAAQTITLDGWRIGFVALTQFVNNADESARRVQIVNYDSAQEVAELLEWIEPLAAEYDLFIASYHGGAEYQPQASEAKGKLFYALAEAGVDIVWGHHPHVLQPWEVYRTTSGRRAVIAHSLGNFVSGQTWFVPPDDPHHRRAPTGDSVILQVCAQRGALPRETAGRGDAAGRGETAGRGDAAGWGDVERQGDVARWGDVRVRAVPISHYKTADGGVEVRAYRDLLRGENIASEWRPYYRSRYALLRERYGIGIAE